MKKSYFVVEFHSGHNVFAETYYKDQAVVLAQAKMIRNGLEYDVSKVWETRYISDAKLTNFVA